MWWGTPEAIRRGEAETGCGVDGWKLGCWWSGTISPGAGTEGSAIWRFMRTCERRRVLLGDRLRGESGL